MSDIDIDRAIAERLARWGKNLRGEQATPLVVIGLRAGDNAIVIETVEGMPDGLIADALVTAARLIVEGRTVGY